MKRFEILQGLPKCDRDKKQANAVGKITSIDLLEQSATNIKFILKMQYLEKNNKVKYNKMSYALLG